MKFATLTATAALLPALATAAQPFTKEEYASGAVMSMMMEAKEVPSALPY